MLSWSQWKSIACMLRDEDDIHSFDVGLAKSEYGPRVIWWNNMYWDSDVPKMETNVSTDTFPLKSRFKLRICLHLLNHFMSCLWDFFYTHLLKLATSNHICGSLWSRVCFHQLLGLPVDFSEQRKPVFFPDFYVGCECNAMILSFFLWAGLKIIQVLHSRIYPRWTLTNVPWKK